MNSQPIEKLDIRPDGSLSVHSVFHTIQGEGPFTGHPAVFVRLWGCNLQCPGCDTDYSSKKVDMDPAALVKRIRDTCVFTTLPKLVVITGGEPFRQNLSPFVALLTEQGFKVQIETNGTLPPPPGFPIFTVCVVVSPKTGRVHQRTQDVASAYKYVVSSESQAPRDGLPIRVLGLSAHAEKEVARPEKFIPVYLQPEDTGDVTKNAMNLTACVQACMRHDYILQIQLHKLIGME